MSHQLADPATPQWVYTTIRLYDAGRILEPTHVSANRVIFQAPPEIISKRVEIIISNGSNELRSQVEVLPHDRGAIEIPIRVICEDRVRS